MIPVSCARRSALAVAVVAPLVLLGGCGGDETAPEAVAGAPTPAPVSVEPPAAPLVLGLLASTVAVEVPGSVTLRALVADTGSGVLKVEFHQVGKAAPVAVDASPPFTAEVPLGPADNGERDFFVKAFGAAPGAPVADASARPVRVRVSIPANTLSFAGSARSELGDAEPGQVSAIVPDPFDAARFYAYAPYGAAAPAGFPIGRVLDYGAGSARAIGGVDVALASDPKRAGRLVGVDRAMSGEHAILLSDDAGASWAARSGAGVFGTGDDQIEASGLVELIYAPGGRRLYAFVPRGGTMTGWGFAVSGDDGATWSTPRAGLPKGNAVGPVVVSASDPSVVYAYSRGGLARSNDGGATFSSVQGPPVATVLDFRLAVDPFDANVLVAAGLSSDPSSNRTVATVHRSLDGGRSWTAAAVPAFAGQTRDLLLGPLPFGPIAFSPSTPGLAYLPLAFGADGGSVLRSTDGGATWTLRSYFDPAARGEVPRHPPSAFTVARAGADGATSLLVGGGAPNLRDGVLRFVDRP